jgi:hypothetical protein
MKLRTLLLAITAGCAFAIQPAAAHHNSPMNEFINMPEHAEDTHNAAVEAVLERMDENDRVSGSMTGGSEEMDPADSSRFLGPQSMPDVPGASNRAGGERAPHL